MDLEYKNEYKILFDICFKRASFLKSELDIIEKIFNYRVINELIREYDLKRISIYGGGLIGILTYYAFYNNLDVSYIIDKNYSMSIPVDGLKPVGLSELGTLNDVGVIIVTSWKHWDEIKKDLSTFQNVKEYYLINEMLRGK